MLCTPMNCSRSENASQERNGALVRDVASEAVKLTQHTRQARTTKVQKGYCLEPVRAVHDEALPEKRSRQSAIHFGTCSCPVILSLLEYFPVNMRVLNPARAHSNTGHALGYDQPASAPSTASRPKSKPKIKSKPPAASAVAPVYSYQEPLAPAARDSSCKSVTGSVAHPMSICICFYPCSCTMRIMYHTCPANLYVERSSMLGQLSPLPPRVRWRRRREYFESACAELLRKSRASKRLRDRHLLQPCRW
jgi:hypothetical protein